MLAISFCKENIRQTRKQAKRNCDKLIVSMLSILYNAFIQYFSIEYQIIALAMVDKDIKKKV